jgi:hypothetical protein
MKRGHIQILSEFIGGLNDATAAASQLVHHFNNPKWMAVRDMLNIIRDGYVAETIQNGAKYD